MVRLQSENGKDYEYDPSNSLIDEDAWGKFYRGVCRNALESREVRIYELNVYFHLPEYMLRRLRVESHLCYSHPNIIPVIDFVVNIDEHQANDCQLFFIEEYISGIYLSNFLDGKINVSKYIVINELCSIFQCDRVKFAKKVTKGILQGLDFLHGRAICLRYVDPESILITNDGVAKIPIMNCFIYDILCYIHSDGIISAGLMTLIRHLPASYLPPEMILCCERNIIDNRSDIYSVGILFFHMLTGHIPYKGQDIEIMSKHLNGKMPLYEIEDKQMRKIIKKATEKDPAKRFQSALEFIHAIDKMDEDIPWYKKLCSFFNCLWIMDRLTHLFPK